MTPEAICRKKRQFRLKVHAEVFILHLMNNPNRQRRTGKLYVYQCDVCKLYHLTSRETYVSKDGIHIHDSP